MNQERYQARYAVQNMLKTATVEDPLSVAEIARATGLHETLVRTHVCNAVKHGLAHNTNPGHRCAASYAWGLRPVAVGSGRERFTPSGRYTGGELRPYTGRVGAMDAYALPSMVDGKTRAPRKPLLLSSSAQTGPAAMRGRL